MYILNGFERWEITFSVKINSKFPHKVRINEIEFEQKEKDTFAIMVIESKDIEEAQNMAKEKIDGVLRVMGVILNQQVTAEIKQVKSNTNCTSYLDLNSKGEIRTQFPIDKISNIEDLYYLSLNDENVNKIIKLLNKPYPKKWGNLYKIYEIINHDINIENKGWVTHKKIKSFTHTANHPEALGIIESRHGYIKQDPPKEPMKINEAIDLIESIMIHWIEYKKELFNMK